MASLKLDLRSLATHVHTNLVHYNLWTNVQIHNVSTNDVVVLSGTPATKLRPDDADGLTEWVVARSLVPDYSVTTAQINQWFSAIEELNGTRPSRVTIAIVNDDGTVVYYFIHDGVVKPRQN
jgi:tRNA-splicing endonuclease subunit Sen15